MQQLGFCPKNMETLQQPRDHSWCHWRLTPPPPLLSRIPHPLLSSPSPSLPTPPTPGFTGQPEQHSGAADLEGRDPHSRQTLGLRHRL